MPAKNRIKRCKLHSKLPITSSNTNTKRTFKISATAPPAESLTNSAEFQTPPCSKRICHRYTYEPVYERISQIQYCQFEVDAACQDATFGEIISRLIIRNKAYKVINFGDVLPLARLLVQEAECKTGSGLWIALKFAGKRRFAPRAKTMAFCCQLETIDLIADEAEDLNKLNWDIAPYARRCNLLA